MDHIEPEPGSTGGFTLLEITVVVAILAVLASVLILRTQRVQIDSRAIAVSATLNTVREAFVGSPSAPGYIADMQYIPVWSGTAMRVGDLVQPPNYLTSGTIYDPLAGRGWRGPYLRNVQPVRNTNPERRGFFPAADDVRYARDLTFLQRGFYDSESSSVYGTAGDPAVADIWGNPIVLQIPPASAFNSPTDEKRLRYARLVSAGVDGVLDTPLNDPLAGMTADGPTGRGDDIVIFLNRADVYESSPGQ